CARRCKSAWRLLRERLTKGLFGQSNHAPAPPCAARKPVMTTDLDRLIEAVEGDCVNWLGWARRDDVLPGELWAVARDADRGSLDAAVALLEALLPGWGW